MAGPFVGGPAQPSPGDYTQQAAGPAADGPAGDRRCRRIAACAMHPEAFRDEYGFRYDARGNRIDGGGHVISPHTTTP